jgi:hypothetical protein
MLENRNIIATLSGETLEASAVRREEYYRFSLGA